MDETIEQLEAELARYAALEKTGGLRIPAGVHPGTRWTDHSLEALAAMKQIRDTATTRKHREQARKEYDIRLRQIVYALRQLNPGK